MHRRAYGGTFSDQFTTPGAYIADPFHSAGMATLTVTASAVPEPSTFGLAALSTLLTAAVLRKRWAAFKVRV
jgi:hypothetical protein